jgi:hypothetical protein
VAPKQFLKDVKATKECYVIVSKRVTKGQWDKVESNIEKRDMAEEVHNFLNKFPNIAREHLP